MSVDKAQAKQVIQRIDEFISTARRVKGDPFADFVLFLVDMAQLIHVNQLLATFCLEHGEEDRVNAVQTINQALITQMTVRLSETYCLSDEDCKEAIKLSDQIIESLRVKPK